jgi:hypothetical protein
MKFAIYAIPTSTLEIRCVDGRFDYINPGSYSEYTPGTAAHWQAILNAPGIKANRTDVLAKLRNCGTLCTYCRAIAKTFYSVPDNVELYQPGDFGVKL